VRLAGPRLSAVAEPQAESAPVTTSREVHEPITTAITLPAARPTPSEPVTGRSPSDYAASLASALAGVKRYRSYARATHQQGIVLLYFRLDRSGTVLSWHIARSSGYRALDEEVGEMVAAAAPFPPFPGSMPQSSESFVVPIEFSLAHR